MKGNMLMWWLSPDRVRALMPACPPAIRVRVVTFMLVTGTVMMMLDRGLTPREVLVLLGVATLVTVVLTKAKVGVTSLLRAVSSASRGGLTDGAVTA